MIKKNSNGPQQLIEQPIDCEQVFERLTAGPFPQDDLRDDRRDDPRDVSQDDRIQLHLRCCHDCRTFAEAMRPAVGLFHESLAEQARIDLPVFAGTLPKDDRMLLTIRQAIADSKSSHLVESRNPRASARLRGKRGYLSTCFLAVSILVLFAFFGGMGVYPLLDQPNQQIARSESVPPNAGTLISFREPDRPVDQEQFAEWINSLSCQEAVAGTQSIFMQHDVVTGSMLRGICCSKCHSSASSVSIALDTDQIAGLVQTCGSCHDITN